ncbi:MAG: flagellar protein FliT [Lachnospiraceae bacterium]|jgi:glutathionyl-hydroquinone reductase|nr:flagellar protein FliT [Lachnospiraceae bacterium]MDE6990779.1 flagellar protein FliT [Lachnospiraceae bacterium]
MTENYLQIMTESLEKKLEVLDKVYEINKRQLEVSTKRPFDAEAYDVVMDEKGELIDELNRLDDGFTSTYELVREEVQGNPDKYREKVQRMQDLVREAVAKGVSIEAQEQRNKASMEAALTSKRQEIRERKVTASAATKYYSAVSRLNTVDPQLMDHKK